MFCLFSSVSSAAADSSLAAADSSSAESVDPTSIGNNLEKNKAATKINSLMRRRLSQKVVAAEKSKRIFRTSREKAEQKFQDELALDPELIEKYKLEVVALLNTEGMSDQVEEYRKKTDEAIKEEIISSYKMSILVQELLRLQDESIAKARANGEEIGFTCNIL